MLELAGVNSGYGPVTVLRDISLWVDRAEIVVLLGANGAGKSTLLKTIAGLLTPSAGTIRLDGREVTGLPPEAMARAGLVLVPEGRQLFGALTVMENLLLGAHVRRRDRRATAAALERVFGLFPVLEQRTGQRADSLSGGEQQMVAVGRGLMAQPEMILLDEPSLGLAPIVVARLLEALRTLRADGTTVLLVEQHAMMALPVADRAYVLERGRIVIEGTGQQIAADPKVRASYLGHLPTGGLHQEERTT